MTEKEIKLARGRYNEVVPYEKKENLKQMKTELLNLEQNDIVRRYIELKNQATTMENEINDPANLTFAFGDISAKTGKSCNLYLVMGYFSSILDLENFYSLSKENPNVRYKYYINVETEKLEVISMSNVKEFEKNNIIIDVNSGIIKKAKVLNKLNEIRSIYFNYLLEENQQVAIQKTKKKVEKHEI